MVQVKQNKLQISNREFTATRASKNCDKESQTVTLSQKSKQNITTAVLPRKRTVNKQMPNINKNISQSAKISKSEIIVIPEIPKRLKRAVELNLQARSKAQSFWKKNNDYAGRFETKLLENMEIWEDGNELKENFDLGQLYESENSKEFSFMPMWLWHWDNSFPDIPEIIDYGAIEEVRQFYSLLSEVQWLCFLLNLYKSIDEVFLICVKWISKTVII
ncbi:uncharacterized protein LOC111612517 [Centruroides sculpturatus]|uniref:uncharacterized protein LOC111612517 n=1 Tax=Centruroides sculpturatus TaxID=218467 RepID=UPI000C6CE78A|nr:uncharacterized protein LOC111612517 [Centruroides sculpturatus]